MFSDKYFLTQAVLERKKTMTRRIVPAADAIIYESDIKTNKTFEQIILDRATYKVGEIVAIAQSYEQVLEDRNMIEYTPFYKFFQSKGFNNKMFVCAKNMPHHIKITNIRIEYLQDISNEDCLREGIFKFQMCYVFQERLMKIKNFVLDTPREAFRILFDKVSGKGIWDSNPLVYVYEFELID